ncbi:Hypothetical protein CINCED_3A014505 [Cinara cedri]|uniref:Uncharacterized protein n=1 Tax=Cinara cedri TaxID=506608 RepID=A0A5E4NEA4_9HEMI|nr:Hypothetical protein CINCED_3A014505 [Cinara cedri]
MMMSIVLRCAFVAFAVIQVARARKYCNCDIEYEGQDPELLLTSTKASLNKDYNSAKKNLENVNCDVSKLEEKSKMLNNLEDARYKLDKKISDLDDEVLHRMHKAYLKYGSTSDSGYQIEMDQIRSDVESKLTSYANQFHHTTAECKKFTDNAKKSAPAEKNSWFGIL